MEEPRSTVSEQGLRQAVMLEELPKGEHVRVHARINQLEKEFHQQILEQWEKHSPHVAGILDNRKLDELP